MGSSQMASPQHVILRGAPHELLALTRRAELKREPRKIRFANAHRGDGQRFIVRADESNQRLWSWSEQFGRHSSKSKITSSRPASDWLHRLVRPGAFFESRVWLYAALFRRSFFDGSEDAAYRCCRSFCSRRYSPKLFVSDAGRRVQLRPIAIAALI